MIILSINCWWSTRVHSFACCLAYQKLDMYKKKCSVIGIILTLYFSVVYASRFCGNCPPGFFVNGCKSNSSANCAPCPPDTFKLGNNDLTQCTRCTDCNGRNNIEVQKCNGTHDRTCRCRNGYWYDTGALFCSQCSYCRKGKGVVQNCTFTSNTKCQKCIRGVTFSPVYSKTESCRPCKICGENEELVKQCTRRKDTECKPKSEKEKFKSKNKSKWPVEIESTAEPTTYIVDSSPPISKYRTTGKTESFGTTSVSLSAVKQERSDGNTLEIILYVVGGGIGVCLIVCVVVLVLRRRKTTVKRSRNQVSAPSPPPHKVSEPVNRLSSTPLMHGSTDKLLREVSYSVIDDLSTHLNPKGRWKSLAGKLGFSSKDIDNFELQPTNATAVMLSHWGQQKGSTLHHLYDVLKGLKWFVEADIVAKYL